MNAARRRRFDTFAALAFGSLALVQWMFTKIEIGQSRSVSSVVGSMLRDEFTMSRLYLISQFLEDMHHNGAIRCAKLAREDAATGPAFYDSTFRRRCAASALRAVTLTGLDGHRWSLQIAAKPDSSLEWIKLLTMTSLLFALAAALYLHETSIEGQRRLQLATEEKRRLLEELTDQVAHDVASPLSALQIIAQRAALDEDTRAFLLDAVGRTSAIFYSMKTSPNATSALILSQELRRLDREKRITRPDFPRLRHESKDVCLKVPVSGFRRMLSNLLDNAHECGATTVTIESFVEPSEVSILISDDGPPFDVEILAEVGRRGLTKHKAGGSGLGLFQSVEYMKSVGGRLSVENQPRKLIRLAFPSDSSADP